MLKPHLIALRSTVLRERTDASCFSRIAENETTRVELSALFRNDLEKMTASMADLARA